MADKTEYNADPGTYEANPEKADAKLKHVVHQGIELEQVMDIYDQWAETYDKDVTSVRYNPPKIGATALAELYPEDRRGSMKVLDCAAGTGLVGLHMYNLGFTNLDALDASQKMLDVAKQKNIYGRLICNFMGPSRLDIETNTYDALVSVGCFCEGHVKDDCFEELIRVVKPGGHIVIAMREIFLHTVEDYKNKLEPKMQQHHDNGLWKWISRKVVPNYYEEDDGVLYVYQVV